jgi:hypothetical protein
MATINTEFFENKNDLTATPGVTSRYQWVKIDEKRWSGLYPYQLAIVEVQPSGGYKVYRNNIFTLPIPPESLVNSTPFAISLTASLGGAVEQHGGVPFRDISLQGSFGVLPSGMRLSGDQLTGGWRNNVGSIAGGTIQAAQNTASSAQAAVLGPEFHPNLMKESDITERGTGYYQFRQLQRFLESYAEAKKIDVGITLRLAFLVWKEQAAYLVTPQMFQVPKNAQSPHEYHYTLQFRAWRRIDPAALGFGEMVPARGWLAPPRGASWLGQVFQRLSAARATIQNARSTLLAVRSDWDNSVGRALRQVTLLVKDAQGLIKTAADFPDNIRSAVAKDLTDSWDRIANDFKSAPSRALGPTPASADASTDPNQSKIIAAISARKAALKSGAPPVDPADPIGLRAAMADPANDWLHQGVNVDNMPIQQVARDLINKEIANARNLTKEDCKSMQQAALAFAADYADRVGLGSPTYNSSLGLNTQDTPVAGAATAPPVRTPTDEDLTILGALSDIASAIGSMAGFSEEWQPRIPSNIEYVAGVSSEAGIDMRVPNSKFAVPFPYQGSLEQLATLYLGDSTRWTEIAALNNLKAPYTTETPHACLLLVNGRGNEVVIADGVGLVIGQKVTLSSSGVDTFEREVLNVVEIHAGQWKVTLNGDADLEKLTTLQAASLSYFDLFTVHGGQVIYVPSENPANLTTPYAPTSADLKRILQAGDVDGALTQDMDISLQPDGSWPFVVGIDSIIQWCRTAMSTSKGSMGLHPDFGRALSIGQSNADVTAADTVQDIRSMFVNGPALTGVESIQVDQAGPVTKISFEIGVRGVEAMIPVSFELKN